MLRVSYLLKKSVTSHLRKFLHNIHNFETFFIILIRNFKTYTPQLCCLNLSASNVTHVVIVLLKCINWVAFKLSLPSPKTYFLQLYSFSMRKIVSRAKKYILAFFIWDATLRGSILDNKNMFIQEILLSFKVSYLGEHLRAGYAWLYWPKITTSIQLQSNIYNI